MLHEPLLPRTSPSWVDLRGSKLETTVILAVLIPFITLHEGNQAAAPETTEKVWWGKIIYFLSYRLMRSWLDAISYLA
jgi:hypothetical protein